MAFTILWYSGGPEYAPNRCIGRTPARATTLHGACAEAANVFGMVHTREDESAGFVPEFHPEMWDTIRMACGFYVIYVQ